MCTRIRVLLVYILVALLFGALTPKAQTLVDIPPDEFMDISVEDWAKPTDVQKSPFHRERFTDIYARALKAGAISTVAGEMISLFNSKDWGHNESKQQNIMNQLERFLVALEFAHKSPGIKGPLNDAAEQNIFIKQLNQAGFGLHSLKMETIGDASGYFKKTSDELPLYEWAEDENKYRLLLTSEQVKQWRFLQNALSNLINEQVSLVSVASIHELKDAVERWDNFLNKGYSQMLWESLINGWLIKAPGFPRLGPPNHQWIIMHPTVGLELSVDPFDEMRVKEAMHIEILGHILYRGKQLEDYWGFSATFSLREDLDPGIGALVHIKRNWNLGVVWHDVDEDPFLFFSVDLFNFAKQKKAEYVKKYENLRTDLGLD